MSFNNKNGGFKGNGAKTAAAGNAKASGGPISTTELESYKVKMPEGSEVKFATIARQVQYDDSGNKTFSLNLAKLQELIDAGAITVNDKGYINNIRVFEPYKG